jgi:O-antigen/teichoic acid export membrane protein
LSGVEIARRSTRGSLVIFAGNFLSTAILAVSSIVIARLLGPASYGSYSLVIVIPSIFQLFVGLGVGSAITRYSAYHITKGEGDLAKRFSINAMTFLVIFGVALSALCYASAGFLSGALLHREALTPLVQYISIVILAQAIFQSSISGLVGWNSMGVASVASILQAALRVSIAPILVVFGFGVLGALTGYTAGYLLAGVVATLAFYLYSLRRRSSSSRAEGALGTKNSLDGFYTDVKDMVAYGFPIYMGTVLVGLSNYYVTVLVAATAANAVVGYYQAANNVTAITSLTSSALTVALFPAFSSLHGIGADTGAAFRQATKYVAFLICPIVLFLMAASGLIMTILYGDAFSSAGIYLLLLALADLPPVIGVQVASVYFNGIGRTRLTLIVGVVGATVIFALSPILGFILELGVRGIIYATIISAALSAALALFFASRYLNTRVELGSLGAIMAASILGFLAVLPMSLFPHHLLVPRSVALLTEAFVFLLVYLTSAPLLRGIGTSDIERLETTIAGLGVFAALLRPILRYELLVLKALEQRRRKTRFPQPQLVSVATSSSRSNSKGWVISGPSGARRAAQAETRKA